MFPPEAPDNVGDLIADFSAASNANAAVVDVEQVVWDAPRQGRFTCRIILFSKKMLIKLV
jgi:hypothetical protein